MLELRALVGYREVGDTQRKIFFLIEPRNFFMVPRYDKKIEKADDQKSVSIAVRTAPALVMTPYIKLLKRLHTGTVPGRKNSPPRVFGHNA